MHQPGKERFIGQAQADLIRQQARASGRAECVVPQVAGVEIRADTPASKQLGETGGDGDVLHRI